MTRTALQKKGDLPPLLPAVDHLAKTFDQYKVELQERFHVESLSVFGSVSRGIAGPKSDVDILVRYRKTPGLFAFLELKAYLESIVGQKVDLVTEKALKKQLRKKIVQEAIRVA